MTVRRFKPQALAFFAIYKGETFTGRRWAEAHSAQFRSGQCHTRLCHMLPATVNCTISIWDSL